ncbi:MAG TPA: 16S rRNA (guanine(966)-N(2))-methyltransferase RsmD [Steroidobacteraceae bacterium]|nr:16S rRNA (guanine(966)-N(2))-methyltransferase RsmD [Steroidobacteraceae bacterium]
MVRIVASAHRRGSASRLLRIIGGTWRGRRLRFPACADIRPTPDRVRETLFNWLGSRVVGARGLDLFAGSGALGLEALSRGAAHVQFVEQQGEAARSLGRLLTAWGARNASVRRGDALRFLAGRSEPFDLVFLDPPFQAGLTAEAARRLEAGGWLAARAFIYVECAARGGLPEIPGGWTLLKSRHAGEVGYHLFERTSDRSNGQHVSEAQ